MPDEMVGLDPERVGELARVLDRLAGELERAADDTARAAAFLVLGAGPVVEAGRTTAWRAAATAAVLADRAAAMAAAARADGLRDHPAPFVGSMRFFLADWSEATAQLDAAGGGPGADPGRVALLGAWRGLLERGITEEHLVVMGDRVSGVTGAYLVPLMTVGTDDSITVGYALVDVETHPSFDWTDAGELALDAATVVAAGVCGVTMGAGCVVAGVLGAAGTIVTATGLAQSCFASDRSSCLPRVRDALVARALPPGAALLADATSVLDDDERRRRRLATAAVAADVEPGPDGIVLEQTDDVTVTLRYAATVTQPP